MADVGTGATFALANAPVGFFGEILSLEHTGAERPAIDITTLATTGGRDYMAGDLVDWGSVDMELLLDETALPPMLTAAGACSITFPGGSSWAWTGFATSWESSAPLEERMTGTISVKLTGDLTIT